LAEIIGSRLAKVARHTQAHPHLPPPLTALQLAEAQISLITHWLLEGPAVQPEPVAEALIATTHGLLRSLLGLPPEVSVLIAGEKLRVIYQRGLP
jgi:hypothetical protein